MLKVDDYTYGTEIKEVDRSFLIGVASACSLILLAITFGKNALNFIDFPSFLIVVGGTFGATLVNYSLPDVTNALKALKSAAFTRNYHPQSRIQHLVLLAHAVKRNGILVLETEAANTEDSFMKLALELTVDGQSADDIRRTLETEMKVSNERDQRVVQVFEALGSYSPAMGLIGTLIGLIQMLGGLNDTSSIGPAMSLALVTTFYGAILANILFLPVAGKLKNRNEEALVVKALTIEGAISLSKQESPLFLEQRLQSFMPLGSEEA